MACSVISKHAGGALTSPLKFEEISSKAKGVLLEYMTTVVTASVHHLIAHDGISTYAVTETHVHVAWSERCARVFHILFSTYSTSTSSDEGRVIPLEKSRSDAKFDHGRYWAIWGGGLEIKGFALIALNDFCCKNAA